jgi:hypothetical protein
MNALSEDAAFARQMWRLLEPLHATVYFEPSAKEIYTHAGLRGYWMGYFASRAACLGPVPAGVVGAAFYNFHPRMVERAIPDAWSFSTPEKVLAARYDVVSAAWERLFLQSNARLDEAADIVLAAMKPVPVGGRVLFGGLSSLEVPAAPHLRLWHAATLYREYRGDGHVAALLTHRVSGLDALLLAVGAGSASRESVQPHRGWSDEEWAAGIASLEGRGLVTAAGDLTSEGRRLRDAIEGLTDELSSPPWSALDVAQRSSLVSLLAPLTEIVIEGEGIPFPNAMAFARDAPRG